MNNLETQLSALKELESYLIQFNETMREKSVEFNSRFRAIRESGLAEQKANHYEAHYFDPNLQYLRYIIANLTDKDIPYIKNNIDITEQAIERARMG